MVILLYTFFQLPMFQSEGGSIGLILRAFHGQLFPSEGCGNKNLNLKIQYRNTLCDRTNGK